MVQTLPKADIPDRKQNKYCEWRKQCLSVQRRLEIHQEVEEVITRADECIDIECGMVCSQLSVAKGRKYKFKHHAEPQENTQILAISAPEYERQYRGAEV
jgi:flavoprotein